MPKVRLKEGLKQIQGTLYNVVFKLSPQGKMIITQRHNMSNVKWSEAQKAQRAHFKEAVAYARAALADPEVRALYERKAKEEHKRAWDVAVSDYFKGNTPTQPPPSTTTDP